MYTAKGQLDRNAMIRQYQPLVRRLAHHMMAKLPANVQVDDLIQVGLIGLSDALSRYEAGQGAQFPLGGEHFRGDADRFGGGLERCREALCHGLFRGAGARVHALDQALQRCGLANGERLDQFAAQLLQCLVLQDME